MSNFMEEKNIMAESSHLSPKSSEPEPNINKHLVESPTQSDPISDELVKSSQIFGHNMLVESDSIIDELVGSPPQSYPIDDELMESSPQSYPIADESAESHQQFEPIADELVDSLSQTDPITNEFVKSPLLSDPMIDENNKTPPTEEGGQSELGDAMMTPKKKRGRPRKYEVNEEMAFDILASNMEGTSKSSKGPRKSSSNKLQWLATNESSVTRNFTSWVVTVQTGEDLLERIRVLREKEHQSFWIIAATGAVSNPIIHPSPTLGYVQYQGSYDILNLSGSFIYDAMSPPNKLGELTITLANPDHSVFGGLVLSATPLRAACPIQLILGAFNQEEQLNHMNVIRRASTAYPSVIASPNLPTISTQVMSNHAGAQYGIRVPCPQTFPNVIASPNLPIIPTQLIIPTQVMPNHEGDQYEIRVPCPQIFPAFNNNQDETPVRYQQTSFFNLNHLP